ncbi:hypothetical protein FOL47_001100, partial [Perkinsus chesapeaki]
MPNSSSSSVESTSSGVIANMVENPGLSDDEVTPFLSFLEIDNAQMAKLLLGKKASFRKVYNYLRAHFVIPDPAPNTSTQPTPIQTPPPNPSHLPTAAAISPSDDLPTSIPWLIFKIHMHRQIPMQRSCSTWIPLESAIAMCHSVGLFLQPSQINTQYRKGLNPTLQKVADELYASVADVQFSTTTTVKPSPTTSTPTNPTTSTPSSSTLSTTSKAPIARVEDPVTIKLCREQHICLAWTARKQ